MSIDPKNVIWSKMSRFIEICSYDQFPLISGPLNYHFVKETWVRPLFGYFKIGNDLFIEPGNEKQRQGKFFLTISILNYY